MTGAVTDTYEYDAFGNEISHTGSTPNNYLYRGEQWDADLGLYYLRARYYNPATGRFMSRDPFDANIMDAADLNKYWYGSADPVNRIDPSGRAATEDYTGSYLPALKAIGQRVAIPAAGFGAGVAVGGGLLTVTNAILCHLSTDTATLQAVTKNLGYVQTLLFYASGCTAFSMRNNGPSNPPARKPRRPKRRTLPDRTPPDECWPRYQREKKFCERYYDPDRQPWEVNLYAKCMSRAQARYEACRDGLDPEGPGPLDPLEWPEGEDSGGGEGESAN